jgi:hypothetical protein
VKEQNAARLAESVESSVEWFKLSKSRSSAGPVIQAGTMAADPPKPAPMLASTFAQPPVPIPAKSPKAVFDGIPDEPRIAGPVPTRKVGFTISSSKDGETAIVQMTSPTLTVARARMLFKSGWRVEVTNAAGRQFAPSEFDDILKFD